jgi:hypothetical protein
MCKQICLIVLDSVNLISTSREWNIDYISCPATYISLLTDLSTYSNQHVYFALTYWVYSTFFSSAGAKIWGHNQDFADWVDREIYAYLTYLTMLFPSNQTPSQFMQWVQSFCPAGSTAVIDFLQLSFQRSALYLNFKDILGETKPS